MELEPVHQLDHDDNSIEEMSHELSLPPGSPDISYVCGDPQVDPRVGDEYQVKIPPMIAESERLQLLVNPADSEVRVDISHFFLMGLDVPVMSVYDEVNSRGAYEGWGLPDYPDDTVDINESLKSIKNKRSRICTKKKGSKLNVEQLDIGLDNRKESKQANLEPNVTGRTNTCQTCERKKYQLVPGSLGAPWKDSEVDSFLLGLYVFGKNFIQVQKFMENKDMGEILSFYYGEFYMSDKYHRWSDCRKTRSRKCKYGRKIFTGWRQQKLLSRLLPHVPGELQTNLLEVSKSFAEGSTSLENYISSLKTVVGIRTLVEAVGIGKGKEDLTGLSMEPIKTQAFLVCPEIPTGKACSSLTSSDIIKFLTGGFRLSKARCSDIFWEAVWPRLLARGWRSEQPKGYISSNDYLVFLMPGVKKFSRRKLVKGDQYFDSVSDILRKVASEPELLELEDEEVRVSSCDKEDGLVPEVPSDPDDPSDHKPRHYLKPRVSTCNSDLMKFTVVDSSLVNGGKSSKVRELRYAPSDFMITSKVTLRQNEGCFIGDSLDKYELDASNMPLNVEKSINDADHNEGKIDSLKPDLMKYTVVDTSLLHGENSSRVRELRSSPVEFSPEMNSLSSEIGGNSSDYSPDEHERSTAGESVNRVLHAADARLNCDQDAADPQLNDEVGVADMLFDGDDPQLNDELGVADMLFDGDDPQLNDELGVADMLFDGDQNDINSNPSKGVFDSSDSKHMGLDSYTTNKMLESSQDHKINTLDGNQTKRTIKHHFSRRAKSCHSVNLAPFTKRRRLTACVKSEMSRMSENFSVNLESKQMRPCCTLNILNARTDAVLQVGNSQENASSIISSVDGNPEEESSRGIYSGNCFDVEIPCGNQEKHQSQASIDLNLNQVSLVSESDDPLKLLVEDIQGINSNGSCSSSNINKLQPEATSVDIGATEQQPNVNPRRQSTRNRPLTTRVLEAFESGFFTKKKRKTTELRKEIIPFSSPSRKARSKVRLNSDRANAGTRIADAKVEKETDGAFIVKKHTVS